MPYQSKLPSFDVPNIDLPSFLFDFVRRNTVYGKNPDLPVLVDDKITLTFSQLEQLTRQFASGLVNTAGLQPGDALGIVLHNTVFYPVIALGAQMAGGVVSTSNPEYSARELAHNFKLTDARFIVTVEKNVPVVREALKVAKMVVPDSQIFTIDGNDNTIHKLFSPLPFKQVFLTTFDQVKSKPAFIIFSSGTTGLQKGVMLTHRNVVANILQNIAFDKHDETISAVDARIPRQAWMAVLPFFHSYGLTMIMLLGIAKGAYLVIMRCFEVEEFCRLVQDHRPSVAHLVPPILLRLAKDPVARKYDLTSFVYMNSAAAPLSKELQCEVFERTGAMVLNSYGVSETSPMSHRSRVSANIIGSVGWLLPNMEAKVVDENGSELAVGKTGEMCMKGPNVMLGYLENPQATAEAIDKNGFLHTGDIGHVDEDGNYYITDRKKELIKYKGYQVAPAELEGMLTDHPAVVDASVIGVYDDSRASEVPKAFIVVKPGHKTPAIADEVRQWLDSRVVQYKRLRGGVEIIDAIPKTATGKILRRVLRDQEAAKRKQLPKAKL